MASGAVAASILADLKRDAVQYGKKGMRWGVRNGKGSPTAGTPAAGRTPLTKKQIKDLPDDDLKKLVGRLQLEKQLKDLQVQTAPKKPVKEFVKELGKDILKTEVTRVAKGAAAIGVEKTLTKGGPQGAQIADRIKPKKKK